ncbi:MAG: hypothetical protein V4692_10205, partial [Bdellovibrionota bacterium]
MKIAMMLLASMVTISVAQANDTTNHPARALVGNYKLTQDDRNDAGAAPTLKVSVKDDFLVL